MQTPPYQVAALLLVPAACVSLALLYTWACGAKYRRLVAARTSRTVPRSGLRPCRRNLQRLIRDGPQVPLEEFTDALGLNIVVYSWPPARGVPVKGCVLYCHGLDANAENDLSRRPGLEWDGSWFELLTAAGYLVYGFDYQGMGHSESVVDGMRSMVYDYADYVDECLQLRELLGRRHPELPFVILGGSMGACVGLNAAQRAPERFDAAVFFCAAVDFATLKAKPGNNVLLPLLSLLSTYLPWAALGGKNFNHAALLEEEARIGLPHYNVGKMRARYCEGGLTFGERAARNAHRLTMPLLLMHSKDDQMTDFSGSLKLLAGATTADKMLIDDIEGADHNLVVADCASHGRKYCQRVVAWLDQRIGAAAPAPGASGGSAARRRAKSPAKKCE